MSMGVSFVPSGQGDPMNRQQQGQAPGAPPLQQAIQMLSLRLPRVVGANALAPGQLLNAPGGMGGSGNPLLEALLRLAGMGGGQGQPGMGAQGLPSFSGSTLPRFGAGDEQQRPAPSVQPPPQPGASQPWQGGPSGQMPGPGQPTFPGAPGGSPFMDRSRGPFTRGM